MRRVPLVLMSACVAGALVLTGTALGPAPHEVAAQAGSTGIDEALFSGLRWRSAGPTRGGRSIAVAGSSARPNEYYFGATGGGLWKTADGGTTWAPVSDKGFKSSSVGAVAVAPSNPDVVYVGMGETQLRGNIIQGDGVYRSSDGGKTWTHVGLAETLAIGRVRVHPSNPDIVYVAALGDPYAPSAHRGVFRSTDGGQSWTKVLFRDEHTGGVDLALDPASPEVMYASLWQVSRTPHSLSSGGPGSGLFKSTDGGNTWTELTKNTGLPGGVWGKSGVSVSGADSRRVYAIVENENGGVFVSSDAGATWTRVSDDRRLRQRAFYYTRIYADPKAVDTVYVLNVGFHRSTDGGKTYRAIRVPHGDNHDLWIDPENPSRMINSNDGGANVSLNGGETWTDQDYATAQFYNVMTTSHDPYHICGAQQDNSTACVSSAGPVNSLYPVGGGESGYIAQHPDKPDVFFAGSYGGLITRHDRSTGHTRAVNAWPENPMGHSAKDIRERFQWTFPIVFSRVGPTTLFIGSQHLWKSTNEGQTWERISPDLTRADPSTLGPSGGPITLDQTGVETYATIFTIAPSPHDAATIWVGSDDGVVHVTRDGGKNWANITPPGLPEFTRISLIEASPHQAGTAYLAGNRYQRADRNVYLYRTDDYGRSWTSIATGIPAGDFARAIREDIRRPGLLYAGTEHGIHVSFDNGAHWQSLRLDLPATPVHGIAVEDEDLVIGTHGRSFYVLPNIGVLRQLGPEVTTSALHVFTPAQVIRGRRGGAVMDYYLPKDADQVTIEVLDASGAVLRRIGNSAEDEKKRAETREKTASGEEEDESPRRGAVQAPPLKKGHNRFTWDLRTEGPPGFDGLIMWAASLRGPVVPPGRYSLRFSALGETKTVPVTVVRDPRLADVTDADLEEQYRFAKEIADTVSRANQAVMRIRHLKTQVKERADANRNRKVTAAADRLSARLTEVEGEIYQYRNQSNQDPLNYPIRLNNKIAALQGIVESAESRPTDASYAVFKELSARLATELARLDVLVRTDVPAFNTLLGRRAAPVKDDLPALGAAGKDGASPGTRP